MKEYYTSPREYWTSEREYAKDPRVWKSEAAGLWLSARVLYDQQSRRLITDDRMYPAFFGWRVIRMLIGFSLENLVKAYSIAAHRKDEQWFAKEGKLQISRGHDLIYLFEEAGLELDEQERHYVGLFAICALWAGRYPIARSEHSMPRKRQPVRSPADLLQRTREMYSEYGDDPRVKYGDYWDLLHGNIGDFEFACAERLYDRLMQELQQFDDPRQGKSS